MSVEMVAFSNTQGGMLIIGVDDKTGTIPGLSFEEIQQTNTFLVNAASENVKPAIIITTETVNIDGQNVIVAPLKPAQEQENTSWQLSGYSMLEL